VEQARELLEEYYVDPIPDGVLEQPTIEAILKSLGDPYTGYFTAQEYDKYRSGLSDTSLVGIGVAMSIRDDGCPEITRVYPGSPASGAGLARGDVILTADDVSLEGLSLAEIAARIQGASGTQLRLTYRRDGKLNNVTIVRSQVTIPSAMASLVDGHIGWIECSSFGDTTAGHVEQALRDYADEADVWVMDLRGNGGGKLDAFNDTVGLFTGEGPTALLLDNAGRYSVYSCERPAVTDKKVVVLVDENTASASESFAAAIRDYDAGIIVGSRTFGKGIAQTLFDKSVAPAFFPDGDAIKITSDRFYSPIGNTNHQVGILPDLPVDGPYAAGVAYLLCSSTQAGELLTATLEDGTCLEVNMDYAAEPEWSGAYRALLEAIPACSVLEWKGQTVELAAVAQMCGLELTQFRFPDETQSQNPDALCVLRTFGLLNGKGDGLFHPEDELSRAELCQMLCVALRYVSPASGVFSDVADGAWYAPAVNAMSAQGLVSGDGSGAFHPDESVDHQQFITIMGRLARRLNCDIDSDAAHAGQDDYALPAFSSYADWAVPSAWLLACSQKTDSGSSICLLWDTLENIAPTAPTTRDQAAATLYNLFFYLDIL